MVSSSSLPVNGLSPHSRMYITTPMLQMSHFSVKWFASTSGATYDGEPTWSVMVLAPGSYSIANPKSTRHSSSSAALADGGARNIRFSGLLSRCAMWRRWHAATASRIWRT